MARKKDQKERKGELAGKAVSFLKGINDSSAIRTAMAAHGYTTEELQLA